MIRSVLDGNGLLVFLHFQLISEKSYFQGIKPLETLLEDVPCPLREDVADYPMAKADVLMNATKIVEDYFITPLGNIPLEESDKLDLTKVEDCGQKAMDKMNLLKNSVKKKTE